jgi:hypothetical protein
VKFRLAETSKQKTVGFLFPFPISAKNLSRPFFEADLTRIRFFHSLCQVANAKNRYFSMLLQVHHFCQVLGMAKRTFFANY